MSTKDTNILSEVAIFLAGVLAAGLMSGRRREKAPDAAKSGPPADSPAVADLRRAVTELEGRLAAQESATSTRFTQLATRIDEQSAKLAEVPSTKQIVDAMEQMLAKTMSSLDERLTTQAHSIEVLKTTVTQTDSLLERVLESLDSLQEYADPADAGEESLLHRKAV